MNDRERLEELKEKYLNATVIESINDVDIIAVDKKDVELFIEQAERFYAYVDDTALIHERNKRYRNQLELIRHKVELSKDTGHDYHDEIDFIARKALEGDGE